MGARVPRQPGSPARQRRASLRWRTKSRGSLGHSGARHRVGAAARRGPMSAPPTLYEWLGGMPALEQLTSLFYSRVPQDPILAPVFANMSAGHPQHVAEFLAEVFGGPTLYSAQRGRHPEIIRHHLSRSLTQE